MIDKNRDARDAAAQKAADANAAKARAEGRLGGEGNLPVSPLAPAQKTPADTSAQKSADVAVEKARVDVRNDDDKPATKTVVVRETPMNVPHTSGYSAGNPAGIENPGRLSSTGVGRVSDVEKAKVVSPNVIADRVTAKVASDKAFDEKATALDLARRALDGTGDGTVLGKDVRHAGFVDHSLSATETLTEIDRQSAILNKARQDSKGQQEVSDRRDDVRLDTARDDNMRRDTVRDENTRLDNKV